MLLALIASLFPIICFTRKGIYILRGEPVTAVIAAHRVIHFSKGNSFKTVFSYQFNNVLYREDYVMNTNPPIGRIGKSKKIYVLRNKPHKFEVLWSGFDTVILIVLMAVTAFGIYLGVGGVPFIWW